MYNALYAPYWAKITLNVGIDDSGHHEGVLLLPEWLTREARVIPRLHRPLKLSVTITVIDVAGHGTLAKRNRLVGNAPVCPGG